MNKRKAVYWSIGFIAVAVVGIFVVPEIMKRFGNKLYKFLLKKDECNFEDIGPEIVKRKS